MKFKVSDKVFAILKSKGRDLCPYRNRDFLAYANISTAGPVSPATEDTLYAIKPEYIIANDAGYVVTDRHLFSPNHLFKPERLNKKQKMLIVKRRFEGR